MDKAATEETSTRQRGAADGLATSSCSAQTCPNDQETEEGNGVFVPSGSPVERMEVLGDDRRTGRIG